MARPRCSPASGRGWKGSNAPRPACRVPRGGVAVAGSTYRRWPAGRPRPPVAPTKGKAPPKVTPKKKAAPGTRQCRSGTPLPGSYQRCEGVGRTENRPASRKRPSSNSLSVISRQLFQIRRTNRRLDSRRTRWLHPARKTAVAKLRARKLRVSALRLMRSQVWRQPHRDLRELRRLTGRSESPGRHRSPGPRAVFQQVGPRWNLADRRAGPIERPKGTGPRGSHPRRMRPPNGLRGRCAGWILGSRIHPRAQSVGCGGRSEPFKNASSSFSRERWSGKLQKCKKRGGRPAGVRLDSAAARGACGVPSGGSPREFRCFPAGCQGRPRTRPAPRPG